MPAAKGRSKLFQKFGNKLTQAIAANKDNETKYGFIDLPAGIRAGVARLEECKFVEVQTGTNKGETAFMAIGIVQEPWSVNTEQGEMKVHGLRTRVFIPIVEGKKDGKTIPIDDAIARIINEMNKLGGDGYCSGMTADNMDELAKGLEDAHPYFRFSTSVRKAQKAGDTDGVWENWNGAKDMHDYSPPDYENAANNDRSAAPSPNGEAAHSDTAPAGDDDTSGDSGDDGTAGANFTEFNWDELATAAANDEEAQKELLRAGGEAGMTMEEMTSNDTSWQDIADFIKLAAPAGDEAAPAPEPEEFKPKKGGTYRYKLKDAKSKKEKIIPVAVLFIDPTAKTVKAKNLDDGRSIISGIAWDALLPNEE